MDTVASFAQRREELAGSVTTATIEAPRTLAVTATYVLSEEGRKASLLAGGDGRAVGMQDFQTTSTLLRLDAGVSCWSVGLHTDSLAGDLLL